MLQASAPGKLFLLGEYAVLEGAPALLVPVIQRAKVTVRSGNPGKVTSIADTERTLSFAEAVSEFSLLAAAANRLPLEDLVADGHLELDTSAFFIQSEKLGLGSSAALTVALVKLCMPGANPETIFETAFQCHLEFQQGLGSGADIALSSADHPVVYSKGGVPIQTRLPNDLHLLAIWTGTPASTTDYVARLQSWQAEHPEQSAPLFEQLTETAVLGAEVVRGGQTGQILATIEQYDRQLESLSSVSGVNFYNQPHLEMRKKVELARCIYKPSGAGGGDFGIACSSDKSSLLALADELNGQQILSFILEH